MRRECTECTMAQLGIPSVNTNSFCILKHQQKQSTHTKTLIACFQKSSWRCYLSRMFTTYPRYFTKGSFAKGLQRCQPKQLQGSSCTHHEYPRHAHLVRITGPEVSASTPPKEWHKIKIQNVILRDVILSCQRKCLSGSEKTGLAIAAYYTDTGVLREWAEPFRSWSSYCIRASWRERSLTGSVLVQVDCYLTGH